MWRTGRIRECARRAATRSGGVLAALVMGLILLVTPVAMATSGAGVAGGPAGVVLAQAAPPSGQQPAPPAGTQPPPQIDQRALIGAGGIVLIALVLLSRRARKKPIFGIWRPKK